MSREPGHRPDPDPAEPSEVTALAELDAGLPDDAEAARRRAAFGGDPRAEAVLDALAATRADLAALPAPPVPPDVEARWTAALAAESAAQPPPARDMETCGGGETPPDSLLGPPVGKDAVPERHRGSRGAATRRWARRPLLAAAALVAVVAAVVGALLPTASDQPAPLEPPVLTLARVDLLAVATATVGTTDVGALSDPDRRAGCLRTVAPAALDEELLGGRQVVLDGRPGVLLVLATGTRGGLRIVTVDPSCGPEGGTLLTEVVVG
jgi:hypothetical protein